MKGYHLFNRRYTKGVPLWSKMVYKRVRGWSPSGDSPYKAFIGAYPQGDSADHMSWTTPHHEIGHCKRIFSTQLIKGQFIFSYLGQKLSSSSQLFKHTYHNTTVVILSWHKRVNYWYINCFCFCLFSWAARCTIWAFFCMATASQA